jgi:HupE/UreJ protein
LKVPLRAAKRFTLAVLLLITMPRAFAHEVPVEHVVDLSVEPRGNDLLVRVRLPAAVVGDANLPRLADGRLDAASSPERLRIVAADLARNLELQQGEASLPGTVESAQVGADRRSIDVVLRYPGGGGGDVSARLNAFRAAGAPVRTNLRYRLPSGRDHAVSVTGQPARITFDPGIREVLPQFIGRGLRALLDGGDHLLFLICVLLPIRRARFAVALFAAAACGQAIAIGFSVLRPATLEWSVDALAMIAASAVVIAALQNIVRARELLVLPLAFVFGLLNGFSFGHDLVLAMPLAWSHAAVAAAAFAGTVLVGELWLGALAWATRTWLDERGVPERIASILASALIIHSAAHRLVDRGHVVAQAGTFSAERALVWVTLGWLSLMLLVAIAGALSARAGDGRGPLPDTTGARAS